MNAIMAAVWQTLVANLALIAVLVVAWDILGDRTARFRPRTQSLFLGAILGAGAVASMAMAQPVPPGFLFDLRAPLIASSAFFGGAPGVLVAGGSALAYRLYLGGQGVNVGIVHAVSHTVGALHHVHHGTANSIVLPHGMRFNSAVVPNRYVRIARAMGVNAGGRPEGEVIEDGIAAVEQLALDCGLPARLRDVGVPEDALPAVADGTLMDGTMLSNPRQAEFEDALAVVRACW